MERKQLIEDAVDEERQKLPAGHLEESEHRKTPAKYRTLMEHKPPQKFWLDFAQFQMNPSIRRCILTNRQWRVEDGRLDIRLAPSDWLYPPRCSGPTAS